MGNSLGFGKELICICLRVQERGKSVYKCAFIQEADEAQSLAEMKASTVTYLPHPSPGESRQSAGPTLITA